MLPEQAFSKCENKRIFQPIIHIGYFQPILSGLFMLNKLDQPKTKTNYRENSSSFSSLLS